ncbi:hypothetical protein [Coconut foliar decay alphasatellite 8]|nr:hypothetical protein [Coconut foliar decay alphasatellite 8]
MVIWEWEWILSGPSSPFHRRSECNTSSVSAWVFQAYFIRIIVKSIGKSSFDSRTSRDSMLEDDLVLRTVNFILFVGAVCLFEMNPVILQDRLQSLYCPATGLQMEEPLKMLLSGCRSSLFPYNTVGKGQRLQSPDNCRRFFLGVEVQSETPAAEPLSHFIMSGRSEVQSRGGNTRPPGYLYRSGEAYTGVTVTRRAKGAFLCKPSKSRFLLDKNATWRILGQVIHAVACGASNPMIGPPKVYGARHN